MRHPSRLLLATSLLALTAGATFAAVAVKPQLKPKWDLGSTFRTMPAKALNLTKAIEIQEGKSVRKVDNKSVLTPSEFIAVLELKSGKQTLTLSDKGVAVGGQFALDDGTTYFNLHVPKSVTANYAPSKTGLKVNGVLLNEGTIEIASSSSSPTATLTEDVLFNRGFIQSASAITVLSTATIENLGSISATLKTGEIDFNNSSTRPLTVAAIAGTISGDSLKFTSKGDISVNDGTYSATKVAFTGGKISVAAKEIDGSVDVTGSSPQVKVRKGKLNLGKQTITKGPVTAKSAVSPRSPNDNSGFYMNTAGDISIPDVNSDGNDVYAFASGNITAGTISTVDTQSPNTTTARVFLSAGVSFTGSPLNEHLGCTDCSETAGVELDSAGSTTSTSQSGSITVSGAITAQEVQLAALNVTVSGAINVDNITNPQGGSVYISSDGAVSLQAVNIANEYIGPGVSGELMISGATVNADDFYAGPTSVTIAGDISGSAIINASGPVDLQNISDTGVGVTEITTGFNPADYAGEGGGGSPSVVKPAVLSPRDASATIKIGNYTGSELILGAAGNIGTGTINLPDQSSFPYPGSSCTGPHEVLIVSNVGGGSSASAFQVGGGGGNGTGIITVAGTTNVCYEPYGAIILSNSGDMNIAAGSINSTSGEGGTPDIILSAPNGTLTLNQDLSASGDASNEAGSIMIDTNALVLGGSVANITANDPSMNAYPSITIAAASISAPNGLNLSTNGDYYTSISLVPAGSLDFSDLPYYTSGGAPSSPFQLPDFNPTSSPLTISGGALNATADSTGGQIYLSGYPLTLDGGAVNLTSQGDYSRISVDYNGSEGQNTLSFAGGPITMNADNPNGTAYGGSISINGDTVDTSAQSVTLSANGSDSGSGGGNITVNLTHSDLEVGAATTPWTFAAKGGTTSGDGGSISISVPDGAFTLTHSSAANASVQAANGNGGSLSYTGGTLTFNSDGGNTMNVDGQGTGYGGFINLSALAPGSQLVLDSTQTNGVSVSAKGGTSGNGGYAFLGAVTNISITSSDVNVAAGSGSGSNGNGGFIDASTSDAAGTLAVSGNLNADGQGTGNGGNIYLSSAGDLNLASSTLQADSLGSGNGGTISIVYSTPNKQTLGSISTVSQSGQGGSIQVGDLNNSDMQIDIAGNVTAGPVTGGGTPAVSHIRPLDTVTQNVITLTPYNAAGNNLVLNLLQNSTLTGLLQANADNITVFSQEDANHPLTLGNVTAANNLYVDTTYGPSAIYVPSFGSTSTVSAGNMLEFLTTELNNAATISGGNLLIHNGHDTSPAVTGIQPRVDTTSLTVYNSGVIESSAQDPNEPGGVVITSTNDITLNGSGIYSAAKISVGTTNGNVYFSGSPEFFTSDQGAINGLSLEGVTIEIPASSTVTNRVFNPNNGNTSDSSLVVDGNVINDGTVDDGEGLVTFQNSTGNSSSIEGTGTVFASQISLNAIGQLTAEQGAFIDSATANASIISGSITGNLAANYHLTLDSGNANIGQISVPGGSISVSAPNITLNNKIVQTNGGAGSITLHAVSGSVEFLRNSTVSTKGNITIYTGDSATQVTGTAPTPASAYLLNPNSNVFWGNNSITVESDGTNAGQNIIGTQNTSSITFSGATTGSIQLDGAVNITAD